MERVITALESNGCTKKGQSWQCPAHDDRNPSLSVDQGDDGRALIQCHAGCDTRDIVMALGLEMADLFEHRAEGLCGPFNGRTAPHEITTTYDYTTAEGDLVFQVCRYGNGDGKTFRQRRPDGVGGWIWDLRGVERPLYNLPAILGGDPLQPILVVEGEKDADTLTEVGFIATTSAQGARSAGQSDWIPLTDRRVVICPDNDESGARYRDEVGALLTETGVLEIRTLDLPGLGPTGDVSDWLEDGHTPDELHDLIERASMWTPVPITSKAEQVAVWRTLREYDEQPELLQPPEIVVPNLAWRGRVTLLAAREKAGKSTYAAFGAALLSQAPDGCVLWVNLEEAPFDVVNRFTGLNADPDRVIVSEHLPNKLTDLKAAIIKHTPTMVVIDTLAAWGAGRVTDWNAAAQVTPVMLELVDLARRHNVALVILHHGKKTDDGYRDSTAIGASVDVIIEMSIDDRDDHVRHFKPKGRWTVNPISLLWTGTTYEPVGGELSVYDRVYQFIKQNPGCSHRAVRQVTGKNDTIDDAIKRLILDSRIENCGDARESKYFTSIDVVAGSEPCPDPLETPTNGARGGHGRGTPPRDSEKPNGARDGHGRGTGRGTPPVPHPLKGGGGGTGAVAATEDSGWGLPTDVRLWPAEARYRVAELEQQGIERSAAMEMARREYGAEGTATQVGQKSGKPEVMNNGP